MISPRFPKGALHYCRIFLHNVSTRILLNDLVPTSSVNIRGSRRIGVLTRYDCSDISDLLLLMPVCLQELRPQDSIPFLRRVSEGLQKSEAVRFPSQTEMPEVSLSESPRRVNDIISELPLSHQSSDSSTLAPDDNIPPLEHSFVKTTFSKRMCIWPCVLQS